MKAKWLLLSEKLNALTSRERGIIFVTLLIAVYMLFQLFVFDPLMDKRTRMVQQERDIKQQVDKVRVEIAEVIAASKFDPNKEIRKKIEQAEQSALQYQHDIQTITDKLIEPSQMSDVLASLLNKDSGLKLTSVKSVQAKPVAIGSGKPGEADLYQHTLHLEMEGKYSQVKDYLTRVEALPERVFWRNLAFQMDDYPVGRLTLEVYTLSTSKDLIGVYR
ncbi:hypothetical protein [Litoribrevibacter albus]|uniref:MSHA biogenesis protein MshJ n=1 Tax=Litoribrevibacter albus TaxID=1473156 RepID=A0AA37SFU3_9GAMM|nr:hypothetical protein [Litoribrevibacter albus]GLQ33516.1 MSHA biogenesis protein MshJ [Litoribrevibacter albus]